jgi:hypothetical protein
MRWARYRRRQREHATITLTRAEAVEILALALGATFAETDGKRRSALALLSAKIAAAVPA